MHVAVSRRNILNRISKSRDMGIFYLCYTTILYCSEYKSYLFILLPDTVNEYNALLIFLIPTSLNTVFLCNYNTPFSHRVQLCTTIHIFTGHLVTFSMSAYSFHFSIFILIICRHSLYNRKIGFFCDMSCKFFPKSVFVYLL